MKGRNGLGKAKELQRLVEKLLGEEGSDEKYMRLLLMASKLSKPYSGYISAPDLLHDALYAIISGNRTWNESKDIDELYFLREVMRSTLYNQVRKTSSQRYFEEGEAEAIEDLSARDAHALRLNTRSTLKHLREKHPEEFNFLVEAFQRGMQDGLPAKDVAKNMKMSAPAFSKKMSKLQGIVREWLGSTQHEERKRAK